MKCPRLIVPLALAMLAYSTTAGGAEALFDHYEVEIDAAERTVLTGFFLGGPTAEIALVGTEGGASGLRLMGLRDGSWVPLLETTLPSRALFVDTLDVDGRERLIYYGEDGVLRWFDPEAMTEHPLASVSTSYRGGRRSRGEIPHIDITRDLTGDGRADVVVPDVDGFWVAVRKRDGTFREAVKLGPPEPLLAATATDFEPSYGALGISAFTAPRYLQRVHSLDYDHDGRTDLVFWNVDHFDVYRQRDDGGFDTQPRTFTVDVPFDSDGDYATAFAFGDSSVLALLLGLRRRSEVTVLHGFRDMDGDGLADLVTLTLSGRSMFRMRTRYRVHFGTPIEGGTSFASVAGATLRPRGRAGAGLAWGYAVHQLEDFDGDGQVDIARGDVVMGPFGMTRAMVGKSVAIDLEVYRMENGVYPTKPAVSRKIRPDLMTFDGPGVYFPSVLHGDVNGDGRVDLIVGQNRQELRVFLGEPGGRLLSRRPIKVAVHLPDHELGTRAVDLNGDTKQDLIVHHRSDDAPKLMALVAR